MQKNSPIHPSFPMNKVLVKRPAKGALKHDYLVPGGPYEEQWDWDAFFVGVSLLADIKSEAIFLKGWALNYLHHTDTKTGFTPGLVTPAGRDARLHHIKPFLAQGIYFASKALNDFSWIKPEYTKLKLSITYRERDLWSKEYGLGMWYDSMESGADNNIACLPYPNGSVISADLNAFMYREYKALSLIAKQIGKAGEAKQFEKKAEAVKKNVNKYLWDNVDKTYYNVDTATGKFIKHHTYSNMVPLWAKLATPANGKAMIKRYWTNPKYMWSKYGIRTLAKNDPSYNNANIIKPHSNWQGPVWPIANYIYMHGLLNYGFQKEAQQLAKKIVDNCVRDIETTGGMHENYDAETGLPLAAPNFVSWNLLVGQMIDQSKTKYNPFTL